VAAVSAQKKRLDDLEKDAERIKRDFDQYFLGLSKRPPTTAQAQFAGLMRKIKEDELREWGTQDRFRFNQIHARFVSLERVWAREMKQIEDGTHKRDKLKLSLARKREAEAAARLALATQLSSEGSTATQRPADPLDSIDVDMDSFNEDSLSGLAPPRGVPAAAKPAAPKPPPTKPPPPATSKPGDIGGLSEQRLQALYKVYMDAKKRTGEASNLSFEALRTQIAKQVPQIRQKHNCQTVDFKVVLKDGKAMLKAIPK
jgi:hypothetical protein